jgi:hypothetical protein
MGFQPPIIYNNKKSQIILNNQNQRYRFIRNPSIATQIYYFTFDKNLIFVKLYPWDS